MAASGQQPTAPICEVFSSVQGEGPLVGVRQVFVRFRGCDLTCCYCDTPQARNPEGPCYIEQSPGSAQLVPRDNPLSVNQLLEIVEQLTDKDRHTYHSVALTGGEPLLYPDYIARLSGALRQVGHRVYLETAGHLPQALAQVISEVDWVAMDWKLPATLAEPVEATRFADFLDIARQRECFVKMVVTDQVSTEELLAACQRMATVSHTTPLILQPVTAVCENCQPPDAATLLEWQRLAREFVNKVRIIPQCHKLLGMR